MLLCTMLCTYMMWCGVKAKPTRRKRYTINEMEDVVSVTKSLENYMGGLHFSLL